MVSTFDVERLVLRTAVQNILVAADALAYRVESLDHVQPQTFSLELFRNGNLFDVADKSSVVDAGRTCKPSS